MIFAPPQVGKSELASVRFPAYWLAKRPDDPIILISYGAGRAGAAASDTRRVIESRQYRNLFPHIKISRRTRSLTNWKLDRPYRGELISAGVRGPITGKGAMLGLIDDPIKNWLEAQSKVYRDRAWDWYRSTFRSRIWEGGAILLITTRWHPDDLAGRLLKSQADKWTVLRLPALAETQEERETNCQYLGIPIEDHDPLLREPGEALTPRRFSRAAILELRADSGTVAYAAQYNGVPRAAEGNLLKRSWFKVIERLQLPRHLLMVRYWDKAATEEGGSYTAGVLIGYDQTFKRWYILDVKRGQWSTMRRRQIMLETAHHDRAAWGTHGEVNIWLEQEPASAGLDSARDDIAMLAGFSVHKEPATTSKTSPALIGPFEGQAEAGSIYLVNGPWNWDWLEELTAIPNNAYWDQADATFKGFRRVTRGSWSDVEDLGTIEHYKHPFDI